MRSKIFSNWISTNEVYIGDKRLLEVLDYISDKVDILSNSWGSSPLNLWNRLVKTKISQLAQNGGRRGKGILFLWAAGNENSPIHYNASQNVPHTDGVEIINGRAVWVGVKVSPVFKHDLVGIPGVMLIAALASTAQRSHYSNYGPGVTICAPSNNIHEYHRLQVKGLGITTTTGWSGNEILPVTSEFGGTSSATPLTAGIAALVISANQELSAVEIASILKRTAFKDLNMEAILRLRLLALIQTLLSHGIFLRLLHSTRETLRILTIQMERGVHGLVMVR